MSEQTVVGNQVGQRAEAGEVIPAVPHDPAHVAAPPPVAAQAADPAPAEAEEPAYVDQRAAMARRFQERRTGHDSQFTPEHVPPFIEHAAQRAAEPAANAEPAATGAQAQPAPAAAAPVGFTLKVRGKDVQVATRDELARIAEVEPHEVADFTDSQLQRLAQKQAAASSYIEEARAFRDQQRVAVPAPNGQPADQAQQPVAQPQQQAPSLPEMRRAAIDRTQFGTADEADAAWQAYEDARAAHDRAQRDAQSQEQNWREATQRDVQTFAERNADIAGNQAASDLLFITASREMAADLRAHGLTEQDLHSVLNNPAAMSETFAAARRQGLSVRSNAQILEAAGAKVREAFRMQAPVAEQAQIPHQPSAVLHRLEEKRGLQAQPTRSGNPQSVPQPQPDQTANRKSAIARMQEARTGNNVRQVLG